MKLLFIAGAIVLMQAQVVHASLESKESKFFANESVQRKQPEAFVLQPEAEVFLRSLQGDMDLREDLINAIISNAELRQAIQNWEMLSIEEQIPYLRQIFSIEVKLMNIAPPELIIDAKEIPGRAAYFDFDLERAGAGRVILNPEVLKGMDKYASLSLLIHETRHSAQLQMANNKFQPNAVAKAYLAAFQVQKKSGANSFCDFLTLANEFEAFQFGNYVLGKLTSWKVDMLDMGTFASQYEKNGGLKIDLIQLLEHKSNKKLLEKFNEAELEQCKLLGVCK